MAFLTRMRAYASVLLEILVPPRRTEQIVRSLSAESLYALSLPSEPSAPFRAPLPYRDPRVSALAWELKYYGSEKAAVLAAAVLFEEIMGFSEEELSAPLLIPVPMHPARRNMRGHNQTELLCRHLAQRLGEAVRYRPDALRRWRDTPAQQGLPRKARLSNVRESMEAPLPSLVAGCTCIIVDDVATTGATLEEACRALSAAGAARVYALALAS